MSSVSFSHEFYKHWMHTPQPVQAALVQELTDIIDFLQTDATFENFDFSTDDLDTHLDDLYQGKKVSQPAIKKQPPAKKAPPLAAATSPTASSTAPTDNLDSRSIDSGIGNNSDSDINNSSHHSNHKNADSQPHSPTTNTTEIKPEASAKNSAEKGATVSTALKNSPLSSTHEQLINELSRHIDDYLSEQMAQLSEDLKSWLRAEISQKLAEHQQKTDK